MKNTTSAATLALLLAACGDERAPDEDTTRDAGAALPGDDDAGTTSTRDGATASPGDGGASNGSGAVHCRGNACVTRVVAGVDNACAITRGQDLYCWGDNYLLHYLPIPSDYTREPVRAEEAPGVPMDGVVDVALASGFGCAVRTTGKVWCWGEGSVGGLGNGVVDESWEDVHPPAEVPGLDGVVALSALDEHVCAVTDAGSVWCWGRNREQQLGVGTDIQNDCADPIYPDRSCSARPVQVRGVGGSGALAGAKRVGVSGSTSCALLEDGRVACWGAAYELPEASAATCTDSRCPTPVVLTELPPAKLITLNGIGGAVITTNGEIRCWGSTTSCGAIPVDTSENDNTDVPMSTLKADGSPLTDVSDFAFGDAGCAVSAGKLYCWDNGVHGELGNYKRAPDTDYGWQDRADTVQREAGVPFEGVASVSSGNDNVCLVTIEGDLYCWGKTGFSGVSAERESTLPGGGYAYPERVVIPQ